MYIGVAQPPTSEIHHVPIPRQDRLYLVVLIPEKTEHCKQRLAEHNARVASVRSYGRVLVKEISVFFTKNGGLSMLIPSGLKNHPFVGEKILEQT